MKKIKITILFLFFGMLISFPVFAATQYPTIAGIDINENTTAAQFVVYFFNLAIAAGAFIAGAVLCMAGIEYVSARGEPAKLESARNKIKNTFLGLTILLASFMILNIINPQLTSIKIDQLEKTPETKVVIPEASGVYLYDSPDYVSSENEKPVRVTETMASFSNINFNNKAESIRFNNPSGFQFGAVLFAALKNSDKGSGADLRGDCSYTLSDIPDLSIANDKENSPPIGKDNLASILIFKTNGDAGDITIYNTIDCKYRPDNYSVQCKENNKCIIKGGSGFKNLSEACPDFVGEITSIQSGANVGILLKAAAANGSGRCQFIKKTNAGCINVPQYSYVYKMNNKECSPTVTPKSFVIFSLVK